MSKKTPSLRLGASLRRIRAAIRRHRDSAVAVAERIGDLAEPPMFEFKSAQVLQAYLEGHGFAVTRPWPIVPTAFRAETGKGKPVISILAEYDALPGCGARPGQWGHGCGHNLLGTAAALAGVVAAEVLHKQQEDGRIIVFGCPAEETLGGKVYMAREGAFAGLDAVLAWHPADKTCANLAGGSAMDSVRFSFYGRTAHAGAKPHAGRSAADAALLTDVAVNYLREHVESNVRIHSLITEAGSAPNVVPERAEIWYYVRGRDREQVDELRRRVHRCARGAAMATETRCRMVVDSCITERMPNHTLAEVMDAILRRVGPPRFTPAETLAARKILPKCHYADKLEPILTEQTTGSSDEDNVSWLVPMGRINVACVPEGTTGHHRDYAALVRTGGGRRGMLKAAETLSAAAVELVLNRPVLRKAKEEFNKAMRGRKYQIPLSPGARPPAYPVEGKED